MCFSVLIIFRFLTWAEKADQDSEQVPVHWVSHVETQTPKPNNEKIQQEFYIYFKMDCDVQESELGGGPSM